MSFWRLSDGSLAGSQKSVAPLVKDELDFEAIKDAYPILDIVQGSVKLQRSGNEYKGCCPFHADNSPSFHVVPDKGFAHCFGCGWSGDIFDFVKQSQGCDIIEAVRIITGSSPFDQSPEMKEKRRRAVEEREKQIAFQKGQAIKKAKQVWESAYPADPHHPYLSRKHVAANSLRSTSDGRLLVPIFDASGEIQSLQTINDAGDKQYLFRAPVHGGRMMIGAHVGRTIICEGYATGASIHEAVADQVCVAFDMGNMDNVARQLHASGISIVLAADCGTSAVKMTALGEELGCPVVIPAMQEDGEDFNDQAHTHGVENVARTIREGIRHFSTVVQSEDAHRGGLPFDITGVDLSQPPGFVGELTSWISDQSRRHRGALAVAGALTAMGNIAGLRYVDQRDGVSANLFTFCVAGSGTGKESVQQAIATIHRTVGVAGATHGFIKSEQEIVRNLIRHQASFYVIDEIAHFLRKVKNAQSKGGAAYLDGVIGMLMSAYSKANDYMLLTGDAKEAVKNDLIKEMGVIDARLERGGNDFLEARLESIKRQLQSIDDGLEKPFLSMIGFTTPVDFDDLVDFQSATNGFIGRSLLFTEQDTAPRSKKDFKKRPMSDGMKAMLSAIASAGHYNMQETGRIEFFEDRTKVPTDSDAANMLSSALEWFEDQAIAHKGTSGLEALYLRAYEITSKISFILSIPGQIRLPEHVRWAFAVVRNDIEHKIRLVTANDRIKDSPMLAMQAKIANICAGEGEGIGVIYNRMRGRKKEDVDKAVAAMEKQGQIVREDVKHPINGKVTRKYRFVG